MLIGPICEIFYGNHFNFGGSNSLNKTKVDSIGRSVSATLCSITQGSAEAYVDVVASMPQDSLFLTVNQRQSILSVARENLTKLEDIHRSTRTARDSQDVREVSFSNGGQGTGVDSDRASSLTETYKWNDICSQDGITCSERLDTKTVGLMKATCRIDVRHFINLKYSFLYLLLIVSNMHLFFRLLPMSFADY